MGVSSGVFVGVVAYQRFPTPSLRATGSRECAPDDRLREAIHFAARRKNELLRRFRLRSSSYGGQVAPRNDVGPIQIQFRIPAALIARGLQVIFALQNRGRREDRVRAAPAVSCANCATRCAHEHTGSAESIRPSLRNGFTAYIELSLVNGLSCHHRRANFSAQLDASIGAPGPHDFAVRVCHVRLRDICVHRNPSNVRDDGRRPLSGTGWPKMCL